MRYRLNDFTGALTWGDKVWYCKDDWDNQPFAVMEKLSLSAAGQTFRLEYRSESGTLCYIHDAGCVRQRLLRLEPRDAEHDAGDGSGLSDADCDAAGAQPRDHRRLGAYNTVSTTISTYLNVTKDGSIVEEWNREAPNAAGWQDAGLAQRATLAAVADHLEVASPR